MTKPPPVRSQTPTRSGLCGAHQVRQCRQVGRFLNQLVGAKSCDSLPTKGRRRGRSCAASPRMSEPRSVFIDTPGIFQAQARRHTTAHMVTTAWAVPRMRDFDARHDRTPNAGLAGHAKAMLEKPQGRWPAQDSWSIQQNRHDVKDERNSWQLDRSRGNEKATLHAPFMISGQGGAAEGGGGGGAADGGRAARICIALFFAGGAARRAVVYVSRGPDLRSSDAPASQPRSRAKSSISGCIRNLPYSSHVENGKWRSQGTDRSRIDQVILCRARQPEEDRCSATKGETIRSIRPGRARRNWRHYSIRRCTCSCS